MPNTPDKDKLPPKPEGLPPGNVPPNSNVRGAGAPVTNGAAGPQMGPAVPGFGGNPEAAGLIRYPTQNPQFALQSAIQAKGGNPFRADPYMALLMNAAPGLATSFMLNNVGSTPDQIASGGGEGNMFGSYLQNVLGGQGGIGMALNQARGGLGGTLAKLTEMQNGMNTGAGGGLQNINPFAQYLMDAMASPQGGAGLFASLSTPFMSRNIGSAYTGALQDVAGQALRQRGRDLETDGAPRNFWEYLFPGL